MAFLRRDKSGNYLVSFRWAGKAYNRSLDTQDHDLAQAGLARVDETLTLLRRGRLTIPERADPGILIKSGGVLVGKPTHVEPPRSLTIAELADLFVEHVKKDPGTMRTIRIHLGHVRRLLGDGAPFEAIGLADIQRYCDRRAKDEWHGKPIRPYTIRKELRTFRQVCEWGSGRGYLKVGPSWQSKDLTLGKDQGREPFPTMAEVERRIKRGGLAEIARLWECLDLTGDEVKDCLRYVEAHATAPFVYPMLAFVALTGCRRSEMIRSRIDDIDFDERVVHVRERKRDTTKEFTMRAVDLHPMLAEVLQNWLRSHPGGQHTICQADGRALTAEMATDP